MHAVKAPQTQSPAVEAAGRPAPAFNFNQSWGRIASLAKRELYAYFFSPIAYVVIVIYLLLAGWFFFSRFFLFGALELRAYFSTAPLLLMLLAPAVTMRLLAEEFKTGSYEMLMTLPLSLTEMLLGKWLAAFGFLAVILGLTFSYPLTLATLGPLDWGPVLGGYFGLLCLGATYLSLGLLTSALTRNQIVAFILGFACCFALYLTDKILMFVPSFLVGLFEYLGADYHFQNFTRGVIDSKDLVYYASVSLAAFLGTRLVLEGRK